MKEGKICLIQLSVQKKKSGSDGFCPENKT